MIPDLIKPDRAAAAAGIQLKHWASTHTRDADEVREFDLRWGGGSFNKGAVSSNNDPNSNVCINES